VLLCYDYQNGIIEEEEDIIFCYKVRMFFNRNNQFTWDYSIYETTDVDIMDTNVKISILEQGFEV
jgi:hypothetical protein